MADTLKQQVMYGLFWSYLERFSTQMVSFVVSIIIARLLMPDDYGVIAIVMVFVNLSDVFVKGGFGNALIQKKEVDERDLSSVFWLCLGVSALFYILLFLAAPWIAAFYDMPQLCLLLQVLGLRLPLTSFNTVQRAIVSRAMQFKTYFYSSMTGIVLSAIVGIMMAYSRHGVWALVAQQLVGIVTSTITVACFVRWYPKWLFSIEKVGTLFSYGWKLLVGTLIDEFYGEFRSLYVGKLYSPASLAFYTKGESMASMVVKNVNTSIMSVLFPALSKRQEDTSAVRNMTRRAIRTSSFLILPLMAVLIAVAHPLVALLLTEKWLPCAVFAQILCLALALEPIQTTNLQAIYAMGRSDIGLKLNIIKKSVGFIVILATAAVSVETLAWGGVAYALFATVVNSHPNKRLLGYGYMAQMKDTLPFVGIAVVTGLAVYGMGHLSVGSQLAMLIIQGATGIAVYLLLARLFCRDSVAYLLSVLPVSMHLRRVVSEL